ncbi:MAG TPA: outer membrane protein assembly factor BamE [Nevskiaceae bacterium]|nr:outer membrane protein assembly factor BamE [Nevskiaceae bacterium]
MRAIVSALLGACLLLSGCGIIYKLPTRQGNVIDQKELDRLKIGMTREQVRFVMGTPVASSPLRSDRWDYVGYYKSPRGEVSTRTVSLFFEGEQLVRMEGAAPVRGGAGQATPDAETVIKQDAKDRSESERGNPREPETGVLQTENATP